METDALYGTITVSISQRPSRVTTWMAENVRKHDRDFRLQRFSADGIVAQKTAYRNCY